MLRLTVCALLLLSGLAFSSSASFAADAAAEGKSRPNVLFIAVDDLNDWIGQLGGHPQSKTPNIDRLAERGVLFRKAYCAAPACNPSRVAIMTGRRPSSTGVYTNPDPWRKIIPDAVTLPQHLQKNGYYTVGSGKIYHGSFPDPASWDEYAPSKTKQTFGDLYKKPKNANGLDKSHFDWAPVDATVAETGDAQTVEFVTAQLQKEWEQPTFLACGIYRPHLPWFAPKEFFDQYPLDQVQLPEVPQGDLDDIPAAGVKMAKPEGDHAAVVKNDQWPNAVQGYLASIAFTDHLIGKVLDAYDASPNKDNTILVFWTDHGWHLGEKEHWRKFALWEPATRVPLIIVTPEMQNAGEVCDQPVNLVDVYPTLLELCGVERQADLEGRSLVPLLNNPAGKNGSPWYSLTTHGRNNHAVRSKDFRYIRYADGSEELYDHRTDPEEYQNLAGKSNMSDVLQELRAQLPQENVAEWKKQNKNPKAGNAAKQKNKKQKSAAGK